MEQSIQDQPLITFSMEECKSLYKTVNFSLHSLGDPLSYPETYDEIYALKLKLFNCIYGRGLDIICPTLKPVEEIEEQEEDVECPSPLDLNDSQNEIREEEDYEDPPYPYPPFYYKSNV